MSVPSAYLAVILIWSTTPLAIQWSGDGPGFLFGVAARMVVGLSILLAGMRLLRVDFPWDRASRRVYLVGGVPLYLAMTSVYWSAQYIPSGWISVIFGLSPIFIGVLAGRWLGEDSFSGGRGIGMLMGLAGLVLVFAESTEVSWSAALGVLGVVTSAVVHSISAVGLKRLQPQMPAVSITAGSLVVATPLFVAACVIGPGWPEHIPQRALLSIAYLAVMGSAIGFPLYFFVLKKLSAGRVALIALVTPITALVLGSVANGETVSVRVWVGAALIVCGLACYEYWGRWGESKPVLDKDDPAL